MSLRTRLLVRVAAIALAGLCVAGVATYVALESYLVGQVDDQLELLREPSRQNLTTLEVEGVLRGENVEEAMRRLALPPGAYGAVRDPDGTTRVEVFYAPGDDGDLVEPELPEELPGSGEAGEVRVFTVASGDGEHRIMAEELPGGGTLVLGLPLVGVRETLRHLVVVQVVVSGAALAGIVLAGWWLIGRSLRPLRAMTETAEAIAHGDLSRRVPSAQQRTEVGRLGTSLNAMLAELEGAMDERDRSEERLRRFLADASHELRTPLTSIRGYAELFRRGADRRPEDLAVAMRRIEEEAERMGDLVEDLLLLARLDEQRHIERRDVDLGALVADAVADARAAALGQPLSLEVDDAVVVCADEDGLRQAVGNLLTNARVHTPEETPVSVRVGVEDGQAVVEVADRGPGLPSAFEAVAFERFHRGEGGEEDGRDAGCGTGLGLAIVAAVAGAHGGRVELDNRPGEGASFRIHLPDARLAEALLPDENSVGQPDRISDSS